LADPLTLAAALVAVDCRRAGNGRRDLSRASGDYLSNRPRRAHRPGFGRGYAHLHWVGGPGRIDIYLEGMVPSRTGLLLIDSLLAGDWMVWRSAFSHIILPATILGFFSLAYIARMTRSFMLEQLSQEFVTTARVKGVPEYLVIWRHAFRPIRVQLVTVIGLSFAQLLEGSVMIETVFSWPGIGNFLTSALLNADMNSVLGATLSHCC